MTWLRLAPTLALLAALSWAGLTVWGWKVERDELRAETASQAREIAVLEDQAANARDAMRVAQRRRMQAEIDAAKYHTVRDAFETGDFDAPLPDDFRRLLDCLLRRAAGGGDAHDCP